MAYENIANDYGLIGKVAIIAGGGGPVGGGLDEGVTNGRAAAILLARAGAKVYAAKCASCHGPKGEGKPADRLVGGIGTLTKERIRTVGSYWPYATTLFDYIRRAMPYDRPMSLTNQEVWGLTAYVLWMNGIVGRSDVLDAATLPKVRMPNRDGFVDGRDGRPR